MTPDELRALADEATSGPWFWDGEFSLDTKAEAPYVMRLTDHWGTTTPDEADARLIALAPDLARLCADLAQIVEKSIYSPEGYTGPDVWWADQSRVALAKLSELSP